MKTILLLILTLISTSIMSPALARQLSISDPGLDAAIREALGKPNGPLTAQDLFSLTNLNASSRNITRVDGLEAAANLATLNLEDNLLTSFTLPASLKNLNFLDLNFNLLTNFTVPAGMTNLTSLFLEKNQLTNLVVPSGLTHLSQIDLTENQLTKFSLPAGLTNLSVLVLDGNQLTSFTLPPDQTKLTSLSLDGNPLATFVLSEPLAGTNLAATVALLRSEGVVVLTYPLAIHLISPAKSPNGAFKFALIGPPGIYTILGSSDLFTWSELGVLTNQSGVGRFSDPAPLSPQKFYRAVQ